VQGTSYPQCAQNYEESVGAGMNSKPILCSTPMVQAILAGDKTQTRRIIKPQPNEDEYIEVGKGHFVPIEKMARYCPYGTVKSKLWVKETFCHTDLGVIYKADMDDADMKLFGSYRKWKPSIFMAREFSRITLEITGIKVEKIQDITEEDAIKEGMVALEREYEEDTYLLTVRRWVVFKWYWDKLNTKRGYPWSLNPYVWVLSFKVI
jgi:hypothetical protein